MALSPVLARELRIGARKPLTHWLRCLAALVLLLLGTLLFAADKSTLPGQLGHDVFTAMSILSLGFCLFSGVFLTADCLSEERREGTLGLLFLTPLKSYDVVLGKLAATSLQAIFALLALFPVLALPLTMGGITGGEFFRVSLVLLMTMLLSTAIGLFVSSFSYDARQAIGRTLLIMAALAAIGPLLYPVEYSIRNIGVADFLLQASPGFALTKALQPGLSTSAVDVKHSLIVMSALIICCWAGACFNLHTTIRTDLICFSPQRRDRPRLWKRRAFGLQDPIYWLRSRDENFQRLSRKIMFVVVPFWLVSLAIMLEVRSSVAVQIAPVALLYGLHQVLKVFVAIEATRYFNEDRQSGALELLLVSPLAIRRILEGYSRALWEKFRGAIVGLGALNIIFVLAVLSVAHRMDISRRERAFFSVILLLGICILVADVRSITWYGMWRALVAKRHPRAVISTLLPIMAPSWFFIFLLFTGLGERLDSGNRLESIVIFWLVTCVIVDQVLAARAKTLLQTRFRKVASE